MNTIYLHALEHKGSFNRIELITAMREYGEKISNSMFKVVLKKLLDTGEIIRIGRNEYCVNSSLRKPYKYEYSEFAREIVRNIQKGFPLLDFSVFELIQLNSFLNHQIASNVVFVSVESHLEMFVFHYLKDKYTGKVLVNPSLDFYTTYWCKDLIVIQNKISEAPAGREQRWHTCLEKMLVDIFADSFQKETFSKSEYPKIFEEAFQKYVIDESRLFRYARRRGAEKKLKQFLEESTMVKLQKDSL